MAARKQSPQDWLDDYLEAKEIASEVALTKEKEPEQADYDYKNKDWDEPEEVLHQMEVEAQHDEYISNQEDEFARLLKEEVPPSSDSK